MRKLVLIGIAFLLLVIIIVFWYLDSQVGFGPENQSESEKAAISAQCARYPIEECEGTIRSGKTSGECSWNNEKSRCVGTNFQEIK